jgi:predicted nuclease of predicted toxin-antitoxin system
MRFLADENIPLPSVRRLREAGHDVRAIAEESPGTSDTDVVTRAAQEGRIILTFDRDYGRLVYARTPPILAGLVYFRMAPRSPEEPAEELLRLLAVPGLDLEGRFTVVEHGNVRQRRLP